MDDFTLLLHPGIREALVAFGHELPVTHLGELLGVPNPFALAALSDYSGDNGPWETYATYIVHWNGVGPLIDQLRDIRHAAGGRTIDYKGRKDRIKLAQIPACIEAFRRHPGLCVVICFDRRMLRFKRTLEDQRRLRKALSGLNVALAPHVAERLVRCIAFLAVVGHLLREQDRFVWVSDEDAVLQGSAAIELPRAFQALGNQVVGKRLEAMMYCKPLDESHELLLSLPDLVAGTISCQDAHDFSGRRGRIRGG